MTAWQLLETAWKMTDKPEMNHVYSFLLVNAILDVNKKNIAEIPSQAQRLQITSTKSSQVFAQEA